MSRKPSGTSESASSQDEITTRHSGYPEKHGPRSDPDGWGEEHAERSRRAGTAEGPNQGQAAGERSFDDGPDDTAAAEAAGEASRREPGERGPDDARAHSPSPAADAADVPDPGGRDEDDAPQGFTEEGSQRDYGQGGGQGYLHSGKPGAPDPDGKRD